MGAVVLVLGKSGSGKSTSLRNFDPGEIGVFNVLGKPLPFRNGAVFPQAMNCGYKTILGALKTNSKHCYIVDDSTYLMQNENFTRASENGYQKFVDMAKNFQQLIVAATKTDSDTLVYLLHHTEEDANGHEQVKTIGKMLSEKFCIEGACPVVIDCVVKDGQHLFVTANDGTNLAKAPMGCLPDEMDNDLKAVDTALREYWGMKPISTSDEK